jgi:hypothetical protein
LTPSTATTGAIVLGGTLAVANGGTGITVFGTGVSTGLGTAINTTGGFLTNAITTLGSLTSASSLATVGTITSGTWTGTTIAVANGGTGATTAAGAATNLSVLPLSGGTLTGQLNGTVGVFSSSVQGPTVLATGSSAALQFQDRTTNSNSWVWYSTSNVARLFSGIAGAGGDKFTFDYNGAFSATTVTASSIALAAGISTTGVTSSSQSNFTGNQTGSVLNATASLGGAMVQGPGSTNGAYMSFHRPGIYATYFGLDTDNYMTVGGWSAGAVAGPFKAGVIQSTGPASQTSFVGAGTLGLNLKGSTTSNDQTGITFFGNSGAIPYGKISMISTGSGSYLYFGTSNNYGTGVTSTSYFDFSGNFVAAGNVTAYSDERLKTNWRDIAPNTIDKLAQVKSGIFDRIDQNITQVGVSAQSLREVLPDAVLEDREGQLSVSYGNAAMVAVIELCKEVVAMREEIRHLKDTPPCRCGN